MTAVIEAEATEATEANETEEKSPGKRGRKAEVRDFTVWREDHESLANYINERYDLGITPGQVKSVFLLRGEWNDTPERQAIREAAKRENAEEAEARAERRRKREEEKAKYANETPEEKEARLAREKKAKQADRAAKRAAELLAKAQGLRHEAGLDSEGNGDEEAASPSEPVSEEMPAAGVAEAGTEEVAEEAKPRRPRKRPSA